MEAYHPEDTKVRALVRVMRDPFSRHKAGLSHITARQMAPPGAEHVKRSRRNKDEMAAGAAAAEEVDTTTLEGEGVVGGGEGAAAPAPMET